MSKKKKDLIESQREDFVKRSIKKGFDSDAVNKVFDTMIKFAEYATEFISSNFFKYFFGLLFESSFTSSKPLVNAESGASDLPT